MHWKIKKNGVEWEIYPIKDTYTEQNWEIELIKCETNNCVPFLAIFDVGIDHLYLNWSTVENLDGDRPKSSINFNQFDISGLFKVQHNKKSNNQNPFDWAISWIHDKSDIIRIAPLGIDFIAPKF